MSKVDYREILRLNSLHYSRKRISISIGSSHHATSAEALARQLSKGGEHMVNFKDIIELYQMAVEKNIITTEKAQTAYQKAVGILKSTKLYSCAPTLIDTIICLNAIMHSA